FPDDLAALNFYRGKLAQTPFRGYPLSLVDADWGGEVSQVFALTLLLDVTVTYTDGVPTAEQLADDLATGFANQARELYEDGDLLGQLELTDCLDVTRDEPPADGGDYSI